MANIGAILSIKSVTSAFDSAKLLYLNGAIERDENAGKFRLYPSPQNKTSFFLVDTKDVAGEVCEWADEEAARKGLAGCKMYTVPMCFGSVIQSVTIQNIQLSCAGPTPPKDSLSDISDQLQLVLQQAMSLKDSFEQAFSNMLKSFSDTASGIIANLK